MGSTKMASNNVVPITEGVQKPKRRPVSPGAPSRRIGIEIYARVVREPGPAAGLQDSSFRRIKQMQHNKGRYSIHADETVSVAAAGTSAPADAVVSFSTLEELKAFTSQWPMRQLVSVWNKLPGTRRVRRFENRNIATERLWRALDQQSPAAVQSAPKKERTVRQTKAECIIALLQASEGATLEALMEATGWQAHSVRGFLSRKVSKELGLRLESLRRDGKRVYCLPAPVCAQAE